jgi:hypothetical protein
MVKKKGKNNLSKYSAYIIPVVTFLLGWVGHIGYNAYDKHLNRPILSFKIPALTVNEFIGGQTDIKVFLFQENTGESAAMYNIKEFKAFFPLVNKNPFKVKLNRYFSLNQRAIRYDTILIPLTLAFGETNIMDFDSLNYIEISIEETRLKKLYSVRRNADEIILKGGMSSGGPAKYKYPYWATTVNKHPSKIDTIDPNLINYVTVNPKTGERIIVRGRHNIFYNGEWYTNYFYPNTAKVVHKINDDKIYIEYTLEINLEGKLSPGFYFVPDERIKDKIILPKYNSISAIRGDSTVKGMTYNNFKLNLEKNEYGVILGFLFKE